MSEKSEAKIERIRLAARELEDALNAHRGAFSVNVSALECTAVSDERRRYRYSVSVERTERIR